MIQVLGARVLRWLASRLDPDGDRKGEAVAEFNGGGSGERRRRQRERAHCRHGVAEVTGDRVADQAVATRRW